MKKLQEYFKQARNEHWAIGHFNFAMAEQLRAFVDQAKESGAPMMVGTSEGEAKFFGYQQAKALVKSYQDQGHPIYLNSDHHSSWETAKMAIDAGYDSIHLDASKETLEVNIGLTKRVVEYARSVNPNIMVEGELGYLRGSSEVQDKIEISSDDYTKPEEAKAFVGATEVDRLAIAFGNIHGLTTDQEMHLDMSVLRAVIQAVPDVYIVLHGGSGLLNSEVKEAISLGVTNVHVNTELRVAYHDAMEEELAKEDESTTPYKFAGPAVQATKEMIRNKLEVFGSVGRL